MQVDLSNKSPYFKAISLGTKSNAVNAFNQNPGITT